MSIISFGFELKNVIASQVIEPVEACIIARDIKLDGATRSQIARCLGWQFDENCPLCLGFYKPIDITPLACPDEFHILADSVSLYQNKCSILRGRVEVQQTHRMVKAQTAYLYRDAKTGKVNRIVLLGEVRYLEPDKLFIAKKAIINPEDESGSTEEVLYRLNTNRHDAILPAWGRASLIQRFANHNLLLCKGTYTTCAPEDRAWDIEADSIAIDEAHAKAVAKNARLRFHERTIMYLPYLSFPTSNERKSGFLMPLVGYSNVNGFNLGLPYYLNLAPNHDFTFTPQLYSKRGMMLEGEYRFLTETSSGLLRGNFLPRDRAYANFLQINEFAFPQLRDKHDNRWSFGILESTIFSPNLQLNIDIQQLSDDYYLQDFSTNLASVTQRQLLRQVDLAYTSEHWILRGMGQSYQTLHPINESFISNIYERLPQLRAEGFYNELPFGTHFNLIGQFDEFHWPGDSFFSLESLKTDMPQGPRIHLNPTLSLPWVTPWAFIKPSVELVENYYRVGSTNNSLQFPYLIPFSRFSTDNINHRPMDFNRLIPRYSLDSGLYFERYIEHSNNCLIQTLEPRLFYLNVPFVNQSTIPVYDSSYLIFNMDQVLRNNRFSGYDRIGDTNQLSYAITSNWLDANSRALRANFSIGQIKYFSRRKVPLCQSVTGNCQDNPLTFGFLSPDAGFSPIASRLNYYFTPILGLTADYIWDPATKATYNADLNLHYQSCPNKIINLGYSYLVNGDVAQIPTQLHLFNLQNNVFHQVTASFAWSWSDKWSSVAIYSHNISNNYSMMSMAGLQYDSCCWALRFLGGRTFQSLDDNYRPRYNNNLYLQILLKGLGSVASSDPSSIFHTYVPGYEDIFHR